MQKIIFVLVVLFSTTQFTSFFLDSIFFDPPWGGVDYDREKLFTFADFSVSGQVFSTFLCFPMFYVDPH